jgi:hypothetical protein
MGVERRIFPCVVRCLDHTTSETGESIVVIFGRYKILILLLENSSYRGSWKNKLEKMLWTCRVPLNRNIIYVCDAICEKENVENSCKYKISRKHFTKIIIMKIEKKKESGQHFIGSQVFQIILVTTDKRLDANPRNEYKLICIDLRALRPLFSVSYTAPHRKIT